MKKNPSREGVHKSRLSYFYRLVFYNTPYHLFYIFRSSLAASAVGLLRARYAGSVVGLGWFLLTPVLLMGIYSLVYTYIFKIQPQSLTKDEYILNILAGIVPYIAFSQAVGSGASALTLNRALLLNKVFPAELIPVREVIASGASLIVGCSVIILIKVLSGEVYLYWLFLPIIFILFFMMTTGVTWFFALANIVSKDTTQIISFVLIMLLIASPIAYTSEMVPASLKILMYINPLAYFIQSFQIILVFGALPSGEILFGCFFIAIFAFHFSFKIFRISKQLISDNI